MKDQQEVSYISSAIADNTKSSSKKQSRKVHRNHENHEGIKAEKKLSASLMRTTSELGSEFT